MTRLTGRTLNVARRALATVSEGILPSLSVESSNNNVMTGQNKASFSEKILQLTEQSLKTNEPHFRVGGDQRYFPKARVILLRPNAKHTPYQAKFIVPKSFNKMDLRDYLFHIYGLRALNVTTQLLPGKFVRSGRNPRYRTGQIKKMTIDMEDPFIWPSEDTLKNTLVGNSLKFEQDLAEYSNELIMRVGSDKYKPVKAFDGIYKYDTRYVKHSAESFIPTLLGRRLKNEKAIAEQNYKKKGDNLLIEKLIQAKQVDL